MKKRGVPVENDFQKKLNNFIADDAIQGEWKIQGLPDDDLSI